MRGQADKKSEAEWQAEDDARTLQRAQEVVADEKRLKKAKEKLQEQREETTKALDYVDTSLRSKV